MLNISFTRPGRTGRVNYARLSAIADGWESCWSDALALELNFMLEELGFTHRRDYPLVPCVGNGARCWTDASFEPGDPFPKMKMCAIVANNSSKRGVVLDAPGWFFEYFEPRLSQISVGELFAVMLFFFTLCLNLL